MSPREKSPNRVKVLPIKKDGIYFDFLSMKEKKNLGNLLNSGNKNDNNNLCEAN